MTKKLYVGNLNYATTEEQLQTLFSEVGPVASVNIITDQGSGRSKGFGFVEMTTEEDAAEAIQRFNNYELDQRQLKVNEARPRSDKPGGGGRRRSNKGGPPRGRDRRQRF